MARREAHDGKGKAMEPALPAALMTMTMHMVESRLALAGSLSRCGTVTEANAVMTRWLEQRVAEFSEDQARVLEAMFEGFSHATVAATEALEAANGLAKAGLEAAATSGGGKDGH